MLFFSSARAEAYKEDGNYEYKRKNFKEAIVAYTEGIKIKCDDAGLNAILYTNRATAQFCLGISQIIISLFCLFATQKLEQIINIDPIHQLLFVAWLDFGFWVELQVMPQVLDGIEIRTFREEYH